MVGNSNQHSFIERIDNQILFNEITKMLAEGRQASFAVIGYSMYPFLVSARDSVIIEKADHEKLRAGDILLFMPLPDRYMLHRITKLTNEGFETTGDCNSFRDGFFPYDCIVGKVTAIVRKGKTIPCSNLWYRFLSRIWSLLFPFRKTLIRGWRVMSSFRKALRLLSFSGKH